MYVGRFFPVFDFDVNSFNKASSSPGVKDGMCAVGKGG